MNRSNRDRLQRCCDALAHFNRFTTQTFAIALLCLLGVQNGHAQTTINVSPASASAGSSVTVSWSGIANASPTNWIGLYVPGASDQAHNGNWMYVSCSQTPFVTRASGSCSFPLPSSMVSGNYEMRMHASSSWTSIATSNPLTISAGGSGGGGSGLVFSVSPSTAAAGSNVTVSWNGITGATGYEWIGLYTPGAASQSHNGNWVYVSCSKTAGAPRPSGSCSFPLPLALSGGNYELRLHASASWNMLTRVALTITSGSGGGSGGGGSVGSLTVNVANSAAASIRVYPADTAGRGDGATSLSRTYNPNTRVWLSAPLRIGTNYFIKWQRNGVDYDNASTTTVLMDNAYTLTAVYETPTCAGISVAPGTDSIGAALASAAAGSTFCIKAGVHRFTSSVVVRANDKFIGETGAVLSGAKLLTSFTREGSFWVALNQTQQEPPFPATIGSYAVCAVSTPGCVYPEKVFRNGQDLTQVTRLADMRAGAFFFDYANNKIYLYDDPTGQTIEATTGSGGIIGYTNANQGSVTVKNLIFEKFGGGDVAGSAHNALKAVENWRVENNEFRDISNIGVTMFGNGVLRNNYIHNNGKYGLTGMGTIEGNVVTFNNTDGFDPNNDSGGSKFHGTRGLVVRGNVASNNVGRAFWTDFDNYNTTYENNWVENNAEMGIFHEVSCLGTIKNNLARGNNGAMAGRSLWHGGQIFLRSSKDVQISGNEVIAAGPGVHGISLRGGDAPLNGPNCGSTDLRNVTASNNVIRLDTSDLHGTVGGAAGFANAYNVKFIGNTYYLQDLAGVYFWNDAATRSMTKEQWTAAGQDVSGRFLQQ